MCCDVWICVFPFLGLYHGYIVCASRFHYGAEWTVICFGY